MVDTKNDGLNSWRKWQIIAPLVTMVLVVGSYVFGAGRADSARDQRIARLESDMLEVHTEYTRREVLDVRLGTIEKAQARIEKNEEEQARKLDEILMTERKHAR